MYPFLIGKKKVFKRMPQIQVTTTHKAAAAAVTILRNTLMAMTLRMKMTHLVICIKGLMTLNGITPDVHRSSNDLS